MSQAQNGSSYMYAFLTISLFFPPITHMTAKGVTTIILDECTKLDLEMEKLMRQGISI